MGDLEKRGGCKRGKSPVKRNSLENLTILESERCCFAVCKIERILGGGIRKLEKTQRTRGIGNALQIQTNAIMVARDIRSKTGGEWGLHEKESSRRGGEMVGSGGGTRMRPLLQRGRQERACNAGGFPKKVDVGELRKTIKLG